MHHVTGEVEFGKAVTHCQDQSKDPVPTVEKQCIKYLNKSVLYLDI